MHETFALGIVVFENVGQGDGLFKAMEEDVECNAGFQDIRMETEAGNDRI